MKLRRLASIASAHTSAHRTARATNAARGTGHPRPAHPSPTDKYAAVAERAAAEVIKGYSTSFSLASSLLREPVRTHVRNLYAMVRVADEIVDGVAAGAGMGPEETRATLDSYEQEVYRACERGFSTDLIVHAFASTATDCGMARQDIADFFSSMRQDTIVAVHDTASVDSYVHGSAEVIGLMCNAIFAADSARRGRPWSDQRKTEATEGALALGRAFQKVNFLRDMAEDTQQLGRNYVSCDTREAGASPTTPRDSKTPLSEAEKSAYIADIRADLAAAKEAIGLLPTTARAGVAAAHALFAELTELLDAATVAEIMAGRIRVSAPRKAAITASAAARALRG